MTLSRVWPGSAQYRNPRSVILAKMASYLDQIDYIYPYDQVIGFYLEKAGYDESTLKLFDKKKEFNFYLTYNIRNKNFSDRWKLFYPKGF